MLKSLAVAICLVIGLTIFVTVHDEHDAENAAAQSAQSNKPTIAGIAGEKQTQSNVKDAKWHPPTWHRFFTWPDSITAWGLFLTLWFIAVQAHETAKAAEAAKATVEAMKEQTRDSHQKERARIVVKVVPDKSPITEVLWQVKFQARNIGPTRAFDVWLYAEFEFTPSPVPPPIHQTKMLGHAPRIRPEKWRHFYSGPFIWGDDERGTHQARMQEVADGKLFLHLRGSASYQDIFGDPHTTPFRYFWNAGARPPKWFEAVHHEDPRAT